MKYIRREGIIQPTYLSRLYTLTSGMNGFPWFFLSEDISYPLQAVDKALGQIDIQHPDKRSVGFTHLLLDQDGVESPFLPTFQALLDNISDALGGVTFFRARLALQLNNGKNCPNLPHTDHEEDHYSALYYLHDSSGDTVFYNEYDDPNDGTIDDRWHKAKTQKYTECMRQTPKANTLFAFDGHQFHSSSNPTDNEFRIILNLNFRSNHDIFR